jgi:hypothetical protein
MCSGARKNQRHAEGQWIAVLLRELRHELLVVKDLPIDRGRCGIRGGVETVSVGIRIELLRFLEHLERFVPVAGQIGQKSLMNPIAAVLRGPSHEFVSDRFLEPALLNQRATLATQTPGQLQGATYGTQDTQIRALYYTLHKILAGLLHSYEVAGNRKGLDIATRMGAWANARLKALPAETRIRMWNRYIAGVWGHERSHGAALPPHGRQAVPRRRETVRQHQLLLRKRRARSRTGKECRHGSRQAREPAYPADHRRARDVPQHEGDAVLVASNFWDIVNRSDMYSIGGVAGARAPNNAECFTALPDTLWQNGFAQGGQNETCAT